MEKIVFLDRDTVKGEFRPPNFDHTWTDYGTTSPDETVARIADATMVVTNKVKLTAELLATAPSIKFIAVAATGTDCVDVAYCKANGMGACLGGTANETDQSTRISTHIGLACQPDFMLSKPGLGADEALMIQTNEMARTLAILRTRR